MYVCSGCAGGNPEVCGRYDRRDLRVMPDGRWLCDGCYDDEWLQDEKLFWYDLPLPPEYLPVPPLL
jgi:hypothetical protein